MGVMRISMRIKELVYKGRRRKKKISLSSVNNFDFPPGLMTVV